MNSTRLDYRWIVALHEAGHAIALLYGPLDVHPTDVRLRVYRFPRLRKLLRKPYGITQCLGFGMLPHPVQLAGDVAVALFTPKDNNWLYMPTHVDWGRMLDPMRKPLYVALNQSVGHLLLDHQQELFEIARNAYAAHGWVKVRRV